MKKYYCLILLSIFLNTPNFSQNARFETAVKHALEEQHFFTGDDFFGISTKDSLHIKDQFRFAETARRMYALGIAEAAYLRVLRLDTMDKKLDYPAAIYQVGAMKKLQGDYVGALTYFEHYISSPPPIDNRFLALAQKGIDDCKFAITRTQVLDKHYELTHLGAEINTPYNDFSPLLVNDQLYFSSLRFEKAEKMNPPRLYAKAMNANLETGASPLEEFNKTEKSVAHLAFTKDQQRAYFTICDYVGKSRKMRCQLYYQEKQSSNVWGKPKALPKYINRSGFTMTHPTVAYDNEGRELLLFSSNCPGGVGEMDIWGVTVEEDGTFSQPVNYRQINTAGNDITPFFHQPTNTLYFSSDARTGLGGYDIYKFSDGLIEHGGYPLNSSFHDTHFTLDPSGDYGYLSSSREGCMRLSEYDMGCQDIYEARFINIGLEALVYDAFTTFPLEGVTVELFQLSNEAREFGETDNLVDRRTNSLDHQFQFTGLLRDAQYRLVASKEGYFNDTLDFTTNDITESITLQKELFLAPDIFEMELAALTFDEETRQSLKHCIVQLVDVATGKRQIKDNIQGNDFQFAVYSQRDYRLIASLIGYQSDTLDFDTRAFTDSTLYRSVTKRMYLKPGGIHELDDLLPLTLYFDNDQPDPKRTEITTNATYEALFAAYYRKKKAFIAYYTEGLPSEEIDSKKAEIIQFFDSELKGNFDTLGVFSETLIKYLQRGNTAHISIRGFASPLAGTDYNIKLGKRRVDCIMNHFATYRDGMLSEYIENGSLVLEEISFGEQKANRRVSENPADRRNSVYSPAASRERKVQIVKITIGAKSQGG